MDDYDRAPLVVHNLHGGPEKNRHRRRRIIRMFLDAAEGGMGGFNELSRKDHRYIRSEASKRDLKIYIHGEDGAVWDETFVRVHKKRVRRIMRGGHVGADGVHTEKPGDDDRRVGPNRYAIYLDCTATAFNFEFQWVVTHTMAKAFTTHKWRQKLFRRSIRSLARGINSSDGVLMGDMNSKRYVDLPGIADVHVCTPPTFGNKRYDQILRWGSHIDVVVMDEVNTPSDHNMLKCRIKFYLHSKRR